MKREQVQNLINNGPWTEESLVQILAAIANGDYQAQFHSLVLRLNPPQENPVGLFYLRQEPPTLNQGRVICQFFKTALALISRETMPESTKQELASLLTRFLELPLDVFFSLCSQYECFSIDRDAQVDFALTLMFELSEKLQRFDLIASLLHKLRGLSPAQSSALLLGFKQAQAFLIEMSEEDYDIFVRVPIEWLANYAVRQPMRGVIHEYVSEFLLGLSDDDFLTLLAGWFLPGKTIEDTMRAHTEAEDDEAESDVDSDATEDSQIASNLIMFTQVGYPRAHVFSAALKLYHEDRQILNALQQRLARISNHAQILTFALGDFVLSELDLSDSDNSQATRDNLTELLLASGDLTLCDSYLNLLLDEGPSLKQLDQSMSDFAQLSRRFSLALPALIWFDKNFDLKPYPQLEEIIERFKNFSPLVKLAFTEEAGSANAKIYLQAGETLLSGVFGLKAVCESIARLDTDNQLTTIAQLDQRLEVFFTIRRLSISARKYGKSEEWEALFTRLMSEGDWENFYRRIQQKLAQQAAPRVVFAAVSEELSRYFNSSQSAAAVSQSSATLFGLGAASRDKNSDEDEDEERKSDEHPSPR